jgi:hypothetical protein
MRHCPTDSRAVTPVEALPLLVVVVLLVSAGGGAVEAMTVTFDGDRSVTAMEGAFVVAGGNATIPSGASVDGTVYVIGGDARINGRLAGDVTVLAGNLSVGSGATITGRVQTISGQTTVSEDASVSEQTGLPVAAESAPTGPNYGALFLQVLALGLAGWWLGRRRPALLDTVGAAVTEHALVSGVVGALSATALLVLFVYMAFTLLLLPVSVLGLVGEVLVVLYAYVVYGHLLGRALAGRGVPVEGGVATALGAVVFLLALELLSRIPYLGTAVQFGVVVVGFGAVLLTYFGLRRFESATIPEVPR